MRTAKSRISGSASQTRATHPRQGNRLLDARPADSHFTGKDTKPGMDSQAQSGNVQWIQDVLARTPNPTADLPPTAMRVLDGAMRVVLEKGFEKLTLQTISAESGENVAAVKYYFGNKAGLISVMVAAVVYEQLVIFAKEREAPTATMGRIAQDALILARPVKPVQVFFDLLPHALRDAKLRKQLRGYYETFFEVSLERLGAGASASPEIRSALSGLAMLLAAVEDGLTAQALVKPAYFNSDKAIHALDVLLTYGIPALMSESSPDCDEGESQHTMKSD
jgi:AcrR family transcriptional regulator